MTDFLLMFGNCGTDRALTAPLIPTLIQTVSQYRTRVRRRCEGGRLEVGQMGDANQHSHNQFGGSTCHSNRLPTRSWYSGRTLLRRFIMFHAPQRDMPASSATSFVVGVRPAARSHTTKPARSVVWNSEGSGSMTSMIAHLVGEWVFYARDSVRAALNACNGCEFGIQFRLASGFHPRGTRNQTPNLSRASYSVKENSGGKSAAAIGQAMAGVARFLASTRGAHQSMGAFHFQEELCDERNLTG